MSIASNVIEENNRLRAARTLLREKLALNNVHYENSDTISELIARWANTNDDLIIEYIRPNSCFSGNTVEFGAKYTKLFILSSVGVLMNAPNRIIRGNFRA